jgi:alpha-1,3-rhamnosyl/mannosyltransferase
LPEVAQGAALLVNPLELESIAAGITRALQDDDWCHHAVAAGLRVAAGYSWDKTAQQTVEVYRQIGAMR